MEAELPLRDATDLLGKQTTIINALWQNYSTVTGVLIGLGITKTIDGRWAVPVRLAASIAFAMFSYGNWVLIRQACTVQASVKKAIVAALGQDGIAPSYRHVLETLSSTINSARASFGYHLTIDAAVFAALWLPQWLQK